MAVALFRLRGVPDDEAEEIRALLSEHDIDFYETPAGNWGISMPAIWLNDDSQLESAKGLIEAYQQERAATARQEYQALKREGQAPRLLDALRDRPVRFVVYLAFILFLIVVSTKPFLEFGQ